VSLATEKAAARGARGPEAAPPQARHQTRRHVPHGGRDGSRDRAHGERPPLPVREAQTHLAPELRDAPAPPRDDADPDPGLMAAFRGGVSRAENENDDGSDEIAANGAEGPPAAENPAGPADPAGGAG
jgi:hypothetical protein